MLIKLYPDNPNHREFQRIADVLRDGGVVIYPTDTVYAIGCDITNNKAIQKIARLKDISADDAIGLVSDCVYQIIDGVETHEAVDLKKEKNFFETRVTEYQTGGALEW